MDIDYKKVVYSLIEQGFVDDVTVRQIVGKLAIVESLDESQRSPLWKEAEILCTKLNERVIANGFKPFAVNKKSVGTMEKMLRLDNRAVADVEGMIDWCTKDSFWFPNIRSPEKLRVHFDLMNVQRLKRQPRFDQRVSKPDPVWAEEISARKSSAVPMPAGFKESLRKGTL